MIMGKHRKKIIASVSLVLTAALVVTSISIVQTNTVQAQPSFNGISTIVEKSKVKETSFSIVELVPDYDYAEFGFLIDQKEPIAGINPVDGSAYSLSDMLALISGENASAERTDMVNVTLKNKYNDIIGNDKPLNFTQYKESYVVSDADLANWTKVELENRDLLKQGTSGYQLVDAGIGNGSYVLTESYALKEDKPADPDKKDEGSSEDSGESGDSENQEGSGEGSEESGEGNGSEESGESGDTENQGGENGNTDSGDNSEEEKEPEEEVEETFDQNVEYFAYSDDGATGYYAVHFEAVNGSSTATSVEQVNELLAGKEAYVVKNATVYTDETAFSAIRNNPSNAMTAIYAVPRSNLGASFSYVGEASSLKLYSDEGVDPSDASLLNFSDYWYYVVVFSHVSKSEITTGTNYYVVPDNGIRFVRECNAPYTAVLNVAKPYVKNEDGNGLFVCTSKPAYSFVGPGLGQYNLVANASASVDYDTYIPAFYYQGGFTNNHLFKEQIFNQDKQVATQDLFCDVTTVVQDTFNQFLEANSIDKMDMLYVHGTKSSFGVKDAEYSADGELKWENVKAIVERVYAEDVYLPVIVDYGIIRDKISAEHKLRADNLFTNNIEKLTALLCATNYADVKDRIDNPNIWSELVFSSDENEHYVNKNIYVIPGNTATEIPFILKEFTKNIVTGDSDDAFEDNAKNTGFAEIATYIVDENFIRKAESLGSSVTYEYFDRKISKAIAIEYCISFFKKRVQTWKEEIHVLDVEPRMTNASHTTGLQTNMKKWFTDARYDVKTLTVTTVPMSEFIGQISDLTQYDMIYFGLNTDYFNKSGGETVYNDSDMNGLIYSNVGDLTVINSEGSDTATWPWAAAGSLESEYVHSLTDGLFTRTQILTASAMANFKSINKSAYLSNKLMPDTFRYSGNDITKQKYNEVINYIRGGFPVIFADGFVDISSEDGTKIVNGEKIDNCTYIYELAKDNLVTGKYESVMSETDAQSHISRLFRYISLSKPRITVTGLTKEEGKDYVTLTSSKVSYTFTIENLSSATGNSQFDCVLYFDNNSDGRFAATESVLASDITITKNGTKVKPKNGHYSLSEGKENVYTLSYRLPDSYIGIIPWKMKICQRDNAYRYNSVQGYFYIKNPSGKQTIKILQINTQQDDSNNWCASTFNMQEQYRNKKSAFYKLVSSLDDFALDITTVSGSDFSTKYSSNNGVSYYDGTRLDSYDMMVIGFGDCYNLKDGANHCFEGIQKYIDSGKPVLCTHDTTTSSNDSTAPYWGYDYNKFLRNYVGMDRYAILDNSALQVGLELSDGSSMKAYLEEPYDYFDYHSYSWSVGYNKYYVTKDVTGSYSYTDNSNQGDIQTIDDLFKAASKYASDNKKDIAYKPKSNKEIIVRQNQGITNIFLDYQHNVQAQSISADFVTRSGNSEVKRNNKTIQETYRAVQVNSGQITTYPYKLEEAIDVAATHFQYYQLDMNEDQDQDGESDIVVWYALDSNTGNTLYNTYGKDVRNSYYIYTKGNVTYSGVGHKAVTNNDDYDPKKSYSELKLYINTMIAAYSAGVHTPSVILKQSGAEDAAAVDTIYLSYDSVQKAVLETSSVEQNVYFTVNDNNLIKNMLSKEEFVQFYIGVSKAEYDAKASSNSDYVIKDGKYLKKQSWQIYDADGQELDPSHKEDGWYDSSTEQYHLVSGVTYSLKLNINSLITEATNGGAIGDFSGKIDLYVAAYTKIKLDNYASTTTETDTSYYGFHVQQLELVDLD